MLYEEFLKGTKANASQKVFDQYQLLEKIYMDCPLLQKEDIYKMWKQSYGKQIKLIEKRTLEDVEHMSNFKDHDDLTVLERVIRDRLYRSGKKITEINEFRGGYNAGFIDEDGIRFRFEKTRDINGHGFFEMKMSYKGVSYDTHVIYFNGDIRIMFN